MNKVIDVIIGFGVQLRPLQEDDLNDTRFWRNRDEARFWFKYSAKLTEMQHLAWFRSYLERDADLVWIVWVDGRRVGQVSVYNIDSAIGAAEVGRVLAAPDATGQGYMFNACQLLIGYCRQKLKLKRLYLEVLAGNDRALRLYRRLGFEFMQEDDRSLVMDLAL